MAHSSPSFSVSGRGSDTLPQPISRICSVVCRNDYESIVLKNGKMWFVSLFGYTPPGVVTATVGWVNPQSAVFRLESIPSAGTIVKPAPLFLVPTADVADMDVRDDSTVFIGQVSGLGVGELVDGAWRYRVLSTAVTNIVSVAVSHDGSTVYVTVALPGFSGVYAWDVATSAWAGGEEPTAIVSAPSGYSFRG